MGIATKNSEGYADFTAFTALTRIAKEEKRGGKTAPALREKVYICSPYRGASESEVSDNVARALKHCRLAVSKGYIPVCPHVYLTRFLDDNVPSERELGLQIGLEMLTECAELWVFGNRVSQGMRAEIDTANRLGITVKHIGR
jgi:hypothetical protein